MTKPSILILGCNFAGLTTARYHHAAVKGKADGVRAFMHGRYGLDQRVKCELMNGGVAKKSLMRF